MIGTPSSLCPVSPIARGTEVASTNSTYAIPLDLREFLSEIILTSRTFMKEEGNKLLTQSIGGGPQKHNLNGAALTLPTAEKNSSRSLGLILAASCMQNTVRASLSSALRLSIGFLQEKVGSLGIYMDQHSKYIYLDFHTENLREWYLSEL